MKRVSVTNTFGSSFGADLEDPTQWILEQEVNNSWGVPNRWVDEDQCSDSEKASAIETRTILISPEVKDNDGNVVSPEATKLQYHLPAQYTVAITDVTSEYKQRDNDSWVAARSATCDADIDSVLAPMQDTTHLMLGIYNLYIALNVTGTQTADDIANAKIALSDAIILMGQIEALRTQRDSDIAAYLAANPVGS